MQVEREGGVPGIETAFNVGNHEGVSDAEEEEKSLMLTTERRRRRGRKMKQRRRWWLQVSTEIRRCWVGKSHYKTLPGYRRKIVGEKGEAEARRAQV